MTTVFHIRRPLRRSRSTSFYQDRCNRGQGTYCNAPETEYDAYGRNARAVPWTDHGGREFVPCVDCVAARGDAR
jgi:hypothetical protein